MRARRFFSVAGVLLSAGVLLAGCRSEEQGRYVNYEPGVYKGKADTPLTKAQRRALRKRIVRQSGSYAEGGGGGGGGSASSPKRNVRKPGVSRLDLGKLKARTRNQKGS